MMDSLWFNAFNNGKSERAKHSPSINYYSFKLSKLLSNSIDKTN